MDQELKEALKKKVQATELKVAESLFRWKYEREGRSSPTRSEIRKNAERFRDKVHGTVSKRGKRIWQGLKDAYTGKKEEDSKD